MSAIQNRDNLCIVLIMKRKSTSPCKMQRNGKRTSIDFNAISVNLTIFEADNRLAWTTSFNIDSKSCDSMRRICDQNQCLTHVKGSHGHHPHEV